MAKKAKVKTERAPKPDGSDLHLIVFTWADKSKSTYDLLEIIPKDVWDTLPTVGKEIARHGATQAVQDAHSGVFKKTGSVAACRDLSDKRWKGLVSGISVRLGSMFEFLMTYPPAVLAEVAKQLKCVNDVAAIDGALSADQKAAIRKTDAYKVWHAARVIEKAKKAEKASPSLAELIASPAAPAPEPKPEGK